MKIARCGSPVGELLLAGSEEGLSGLWLAGQKYYAAGLAGTEDEGELPVFRAARDWLSRYFAGLRPEAGELPLVPRGTDFQRLVWSLLLEIPYGETVSYGALAHRVAERLGRPSSPRAVGSAVGRNPISIMIPCHRVVGADGSLTGYAGGMENKRLLLELEGRTAGTGR